MTLRFHHELDLESSSGTKADVLTVHARSSLESGNSTTLFQLVREGNIVKVTCIPSAITLATPTRLVVTFTENL